MQSPKSKTASEKPADRPFVMPRLADHPRYAAALARANELSGQVSVVCRELAAVRAEIDAIRSAKEDTRATIRESNIQRVPFGLHRLDGLVTQRDSAAAYQVRELIAAGHLPATHPCLDGVAV